MVNQLVILSHLFRTWTREEQLKNAGKEHLGPHQIGPGQLVKMAEVCCEDAIPWSKFRFFSAVCHGFEVVMIRLQVPPVPANQTLYVQNINEKLSRKHR